jgi:hypothetical protein
MGRLFDGTTFNNDHYSALELLTDLRKGIWKEAYRGESTDLFRRNLQRTYLERMGFLMTAESESGRSRPGFEGRLDYNTATSDLRALVRGELKRLRSDLAKASNSRISQETRYHYEDIMARIDHLFEGE